MGQGRRPNEDPFDNSCEKCDQLPSAPNVAPSAPVDSCPGNVQGKIAWDYTGNRSWNPENVQRLCARASNPTQPALCFKRVMFGGVNWGGGTRWQWQNAVDLCAGTDD